MKKLVLALTAAAAFSAPAFAADMAARPYTKAAPMPVAVASWTGCYIAGGGGFGMWNQENTAYVDLPARTRVSDTYTNGGRGYFGTVGGGCDYQFGLGSWNMLVGAFGDYDFSDIKGKFNDVFSPGVGNEKLSSTWSVGGRVGWVVTPTFMTYFSGGYTESTFDQVNFTNLGVPFGVPTGLYIGKQNYKGYFLGAGDEYALSFLPGLFWKTEYRFADLDTKTNARRLVATGAVVGDSFDSHKYVHTIRSELVYRFNWGSAVVAKY